MIIVHCRMRPSGPVAGSPRDSTWPVSEAFRRTGGKRSRGAAPTAAMPNSLSTLRRLTVGSWPDSRELSSRSLAPEPPSFLPVTLFLCLFLALAGKRL